MPSPPAQGSTVRCRALPRGAPRATPSQEGCDGAALGFKIGTFPTGTLSPATAGIKAGHWRALKAGHSEAKASALPPPELRLTLG